MASRSYLGNEPYTTLIVCLNVEHLRKVQEAFYAEGMYQSSWQSQLTGRRFKRIINFIPDQFVLSATELMNYRRWREELPTKLVPGGEIVDI